MKSITINEIINAANGEFFGDNALLSHEIKGVVIDNRKVSKDYLFIPIIGERFDGHDFITSAFENGAALSLSSKKLKTDKPYILVKDTLAAFQAIAGYYKSLFNVKTIGITGSVGKTTTKEMIASVLSECFDVLKSEGNLNNQSGVPQTLLRLEEKNEAAIVEMGTNHFGEIESLAKMVRPDFCFMTNIGDSHIEYLGSREGILKAKSEMLPYMSDNGKVFINGDDILLKTLKDKRDDCISYGISEENDFYAKDIKSLGLDGSEFTVCYAEKEIKCFVPSPGLHMVQNAVGAFALGITLGMNEQTIKNGIAKYEPISGRMCIEHAGSLTILNDVYNANPSSVKASINVMTNAQTRKVCILGDMLELGENSPAYHSEIGKYAAEKEMDVLVAVGKLSENTALSAIRSGIKTFYYETKEDLINMLPKVIKRTDTVLVKASRGMQLEKVVEALRILYKK